MSKSRQTDCSDPEFDEFSEPSDCLFNIETFHEVESSSVCMQYQVARATDVPIAQAAISEQYGSALHFQPGPCAEELKPTGLCFSVDGVAWMEKEASE